MKKGLCYIIFCIDRSGSMESIASDMIGGFNSFTDNQKKNNVGECKVSLYQFDDKFEEVYKNIDLNDVPTLTSKTFVPRGCTALYDSFAKTMILTGQDIDKMNEDDKPEKVLIVVITDGLNNASVEYDSTKVSEMVKHQKEKYSWEFVYIGANQDSWAVGGSMGISGASTINYVSSGKNKKESNELLWTTLSSKTVTYRSNSNAKMEYTQDEQEEQNDLIKNNS